MLAHDDTGNRYKEPNFGFVFDFGLCLECQPVTNSILVKYTPTPLKKRKKKKSKTKQNKTKQSNTKHLTPPPKKKNQFKPICLIFF